MRSEYANRYSTISRRPLAPVDRSVNANRSISTGRPVLPRASSSGRISGGGCGSCPPGGVKPRPQSRGPGNSSHLAQQSQVKHFHRKSDGVLQSAMYEGIPGVNPHLSGGSPRRQYHSQQQTLHRTASRSGRYHHQDSGVPYQYAPMGYDATPNVSTVGPSSDVAPSVQYAQAHRGPKNSRTGRSLGGDATRSVPLTSPDVLVGGGNSGAFQHRSESRGTYCRRGTDFHTSSQAARNVQQCKIEISRLHSEQERVRTERKRQQAIQRNHDQVAFRQQQREDELRRRQEVEQERWEKRLEVERRKLEELSSRSVNYRYVPSTSALRSASSKKSVRGGAGVGASAASSSFGAKKRVGAAGGSSRHVDPFSPRQYRDDRGGRVFQEERGNKHGSRDHYPRQRTQQQQEQSLAGAQSSQYYTGSGPLSSGSSRGQRQRQTQEEHDLSTRQTMVDLMDTLKVVMNNTVGGEPNDYAFDEEEEDQEATAGVLNPAEAMMLAEAEQQAEYYQQKEPLPMDNTATQLTHSIKECLAGNVGSRCVGNENGGGGAYGVRRTPTGPTKQQSTQRARHNVPTVKTTGQRPSPRRPHSRTASQGSADFHELEDRYWNYSGRLIDKIQSSLMSEM